MPYRYISQRAQLIRSYYSGLGKTGIIYPVTFLVAFAGWQVTLGLIFFMREVFDASPREIGWLSAVWSIVYVVGCVLVRPTFNRVLPRYLVMVATFGAFALTLAMQFAPAALLVFVLYGLHGLAMSLFWPPLMGWLSSDMEGAALSRVVSRFNLSWSVGGIISPLVAGALSEAAVWLPLLVGAGVYLLTTVAVAGAVATLPSARTDRSLGVDNGSDSATVGRDTRLRYPAWVGLFAAYFAMGVILAIFPMVARDVLSFSKTAVGEFLLLRSLFAALAFIILGRTLFWHFRRSPMMLGQLLGTAVFVLLGFAESGYLIGLLLALFGVSTAMSYSNSIFHGASGSANRAARMAVHESVLAAGMVVGAGVGGVVYQAHGAAWVYWVCAAVFLVSVLAQSALCAWTLKGGSHGTSM